MKFTIVILLLFSTTTFCQTIHGIESGLDSIALSNRIKTKFETIMKIDSGNTDTIWTTRFDYLQNGYIAKFEELDVRNYDASSPWRIGYHSIEFEYNTKGYLVNDKVQWDGPVNVAGTPDSVQKTTKKVYNGTMLEREIVVETTWYDMNESYTISTITLYNSKGKITSVESLPYSLAKYYYNENGLLSRIEYSNSIRMYMTKEIEYEYYKE